MKSKLGLQEDKSQEDATRPWLREKVYEPKLARTFELVKNSVNALRERGARVSLSTIVAESKVLDEKGVGVAHTTILNNEQANVYYQKYRTSKPTKIINHHSEIISSVSCPAPVKLDRDLPKVKKRYMKMRKREVVDKLVTAEQSYATLFKDWFTLNQRYFSEISEMQDDSST